MKSNKKRKFSDLTFTVVSKIAQLLETYCIYFFFLQAAQEAVQRCKQLMVDADDDYKDILKDLVVLYSDFEEVLSHPEPTKDRTEL